MFAPDPQFPRRGISASYFFVAFIPGRFGAHQCSQGRLCGNVAPHTPYSGRHHDSGVGGMTSPVGQNSLRAKRSFLQKNQSHMNQGGLAATSHQVCAPEVLASAAFTVVLTNRMTRIEDISASCCADASLCALAHADVQKRQQRLRQS